MSIPSGIRYALRSLRRSWGFSVIFVFTLTLGLAGVNTIFSVLDTVILRPLPFKHADRLVTITETVPFMGNGPQICTIDELQSWHRSGLVLKFPRTSFVFSESHRFWAEVSIRKTRLPGMNRSSFSAMNCGRGGLEAILPSSAQAFSSAAQP